MSGSGNQVTVYNINGAPQDTTSTIGDAETYVDDNYYMLTHPVFIAADPPVTVTVGPGTYMEQVTVSEPQVLDSSAGPSMTTIVDTGGYYTFGVNVTTGTNNVQIGGLTGNGFTIEATATSGVAVQILGSNDTVEGNILSANDAVGGGGADLVTGGGADNLLIDGNTFAGTGNALAFVDGALDVYTPSTSVNIENNVFTGTATAGADIAYDAASGTISGNSFTGSGNQAIFLGSISTAVANFYNGLYGTHYVAVPGTISVTGNNFSHWTGADVSTFDASYTFANGGTGQTLTETVTGGGQEIDTVTGWTTGKISLDAGFDTALGAVQNGNNEVDVYLSTGDEIKVQGTNVNANSIGAMVGAPVFSNVDQIGSGTSATVGNGNNLVLAGSNDTITVGNGGDTVNAGSNDSITVGNGTDKVTAGAGSSVSAGNGSDTITAGGNITAGNGSDIVTSTGTGSSITLGNGNDTVYAGPHNTVTLGTGNDTFYAGANDTINLGNGNDTVAFGVGSSPAAFGSETVNGFSAHDQIDLAMAQFTSYAAMMSSGELYQSGSNTIINDKLGDTVTLEGVKLSNLSANNFHFS